ncbi:MAG: hypothetical protein HY308_05680 [Gammaproteobacteria bacterium]|nr:hypothetical protein [Gammaproteobacteria bacterium]
MIPRAVAVSRAIAWLFYGWRIVAAHAGAWIVLSILLLLILVGLSLLPVVGLFIGALFFPVLWAGMLYGAHEVRCGRPLRVAHLFRGFSNSAVLRQLLLLGVVEITAVAVGLGIVALFMGASIMGMMDSGAAHNLVQLRNGLMVLLLASVVHLVAIVLLYFAIPLVVLRGLGAAAAMGNSVRACLQNLLPLLVFSLAYSILALAATLPFGLGWLLLLPWSAGMSYCSYEDVYPE